VIPLFTTADFGVHVTPIFAFTSGRSSRSRSSGACRQVADTVADHEVRT
jgi:hypothetical protein